MAEEKESVGKGVWEGTKRGASWLVRTVSKQAKILWLKQKEIRGLNNQKSQLFEQMGKIVFELYKKDRVRNPDLIELSEQVKAVDTKISTLEQEIEALKHGEEKVGEVKPISEEPLEKEE